MVKRMLIDATHPEETRVVVVNGTKLEEFDFETSTKKQLKGNIYLAKVIRIEPSLQAAFVDYGGNRHGFLAFSEIHPDYYQIPVADREALLAEQERRARQSEESENNGGRRWRRRDRNRRPAGDQAGNSGTAGEDAETALPDTEGNDTLAEAGHHGFGNADAMPTPDEAILTSDADNEWRDADDGRDHRDDRDGDYRHAHDDDDHGDDHDEHGHDERGHDEHGHDHDHGHHENDDSDTTAEGNEAGPDRRSAEARIGWPVVRDEEPVEPDARTNEMPGDHRPAAEIVETHEMPPERDDRGTEFVAATPHAETGDHANPVDANPVDDANVHPSDDGEPSDSAGYGMTVAVAPASEQSTTDSGDDSAGADEASGPGADDASPETNVEVVGGEDLGEEERPRRNVSLRNYKIQEVIKRRQILLVQVVKEERGNKGAALTTYLSLAGRYCVLMPNAGRGGGISRKISNPADRKRMKEMLSELEVPNGMGVILRTAGLERSKAEIKRDYDYLVRLWDSIREVTLKSIAPALIYEEGNLIKRSIRDLYSKDIEDVLIEGDDGYRAAKDFMRQLMPSHAKKVQLYNDQTPLFHRYQVETQLDAMHSPVVQLRSGGYIVINPTEALVAIDVNSGRSTKERNIEETALRTNIEAAEEIARQLRLRDLAGLIVIDFIDMEDQRHQQQVERRLKEAMRSDRARIQIGRISAFGLLELSRQRLRPSLLEISTEICPHCEGTGRVRSTESTVLHVLRCIEEEGIRRRAAEIRVAVPTAVALYLLNQKRIALSEIEQRYGLRVFVDGDESLIPPHYKLERIRSRPVDQAPIPLSMTSAPYAEEEAPAAEEEIEEEVGVETAASGDDAAAAAAGDEVGSDGRRRRRRRRRRRPDEMAANGEAPGLGEQPAVLGHDMVPEANAADLTAAEELESDDEDTGESSGEDGTTAVDANADDSEQNRRRRRRGRRGGRRRRHADREGDDANRPDSDHDDGIPALAGEPPTEGDDHAADERPRSDQDRSDRPEDDATGPGHSAPVQAALFETEPASVNAEPPSDAQAEPAVPADQVSQPAAASLPAPTVRTVDKHTDDGMPVTSGATPEAIEAETPAGPPRRGWWQRLTTRE